MNPFSKSGFAKTGAELISFLIPSKTFPTSSIQEKE
jgi:hypothetical protein